jgi:hypothetical protein
MNITESMTGLGWGEIFMQDYKEVIKKYGGNLKITRFDQNHGQWEIELPESMNENGALVIWMPDYPDYCFSTQPI